MFNQTDIIATWKNRIIIDDPTCISGISVISLRSGTSTQRNSTLTAAPCSSTLPRFSEPTFRPSGATRHWTNNSVSRLFYLFRRHIPSYTQWPCITRVDLGIQFLPFPLPSRDRSTMRTRPQMTSHLGASQGDLAVRADQTMSYYRCNRNCTNSKTYITKKWLYDVIWCYMMYYDVLCWQHSTTGTSLLPAWRYQLTSMIQQVPISGSIFRGL